jgi:hypothetical protein
MEETSDRSSTLHTLAELGFQGDTGNEFLMLTDALALLLAEQGFGVALPTPHSLGNRVRCGELLIAALEDAGYPFLIHPHQVSGLDWRALHHVVKLVSNFACQSGPLTYINLSWIKALGAHRLEGNLDEADLALGRTYFPPLSNEWTHDNNNTVRDSPFEELPSSLTNKAISSLSASVSSQSARIEEDILVLKEIDQQRAHLRAQLEAGRHLGTHPQELSRMAELVRLNEELKVMGKDFKRTCRKEKDEFARVLFRIQNDLDHIQTITFALGKNNARLVERVQRYRVEAASTVRQSATLTRILDESPSKEELQQYERRFVELYEQMTLKSDEHRRHIAVFNFTRTHLRLCREHAALAKSVKDGFIASKLSENMSAELIKQFSQILATYRGNLEGSKGHLKATLAERETIGEELLMLQVKQRRYFRAVRELQECYIQQEGLVAQLK